MVALELAKFQNFFENGDDQREQKLKQFLTLTQLGITTR